MSRLDKQRKAQQKQPALQARPQPKRPGETPAHLKRRPRTPFNQPRLPDGSHDEARWDGQTMRWRGKLHVKSAENFVTFEAEAKSRLTLMTALDRLYRKWVKQEAACQKSP